MWLKWLPWRYVVRKIARARGFIDPIAVWSRLHQFAQPSEVAAPYELLRAGVVFHARGLMNTAVIQHNLDWVWPHWVERQFDPLDDAFIPRAFSITHVNLTHRNWTAIGLPDCERLPLVDPRGLLTPFWDGWSLDAWIVTAGDRSLIPSRLDDVSQQLDWSDPSRLAVVTLAEHDRMRLGSKATVVLEDGVPICLQETSACSEEPAWLVVALRPYNAEGVSFVHRIEHGADGKGWLVDGERRVEFATPPDRQSWSDYRQGDVFARLSEATASDSCVCDVGLCTAAAMYALAPGRPREISVRVPLADDVPSARHEASAGRFPGWVKSLEGHCQMQAPDAKIQFLFDAAIRTVILHSPGEVYAGPYTYKRFWFRDAAFIIHGLLCFGLFERARRAIELFLLRQTRSGYFLSQEGEWDSNGEALWIMDRYCQLTGEAPPATWERAIRHGGKWIERKRLSDRSAEPHAGLLPAGFSAEHLGPNDYYYWDDFWGIAGLRAAGRMLTWLGDARAASELAASANGLSASIDRSLSETAARRKQNGIPASPYRRLDAGAIGSLAASYPLQIWDPQDRRLLDSAEFLLENCFVHGGFFQDMIHSGVNAYLTLHVAQVLLRAGDPRAGGLVQAVAGLASPTGQWPEAIHPRTLGGCMGDGQHAWAAAEWLLMLRNCFVRDETSPPALIVGSGIPQDWLRPNAASSKFGPAPTPWGAVSIVIQPQDQGATVRWSADWRGNPPPVDIRLPGFAAARVPAADGEIFVARLVEGWRDDSAVSPTRCTSFPHTTT